MYNTTKYSHMEPKKIMILMAKTGGGHNAVAEAVKEVFDRFYKGKIEAEIVDGLRTFAPFPISHLDTTYPWQIKLDGGVNTMATQGQGYFGTTETISTYIRETTKTALSSSKNGMPQT